MQNKINFLTLYQSVFESLNEGNLQSLLDRVYKITNIPILAVDIMYNLLGASSLKHTGDYYWDYLLEHKGYETDMTVRLYSDGIMQSVNENEAPYVINWGAATENYPKILGVIKINQIVEGYVVMQCRKNEITNDHLKAMAIIQDACSLLMKEIDSENSMELSHQKAFANELFNHRILSNKQLDTWKNTTGFSLNPNYRILAISTNTIAEKNVLSFIRKKIQQIPAKQLLLIQHNVLYILQYDFSDTSVKLYSAELLNLLKKFHAYCGISNSFDNLLDIADYQMQAHDAMTWGRKNDCDKFIYMYSDYYLSAILYPRTEQMPPNNYISPIIIQVQEYDRIHSTDLYFTLQKYIKNLCNTSNTAAELHLHRNSLLYRINKIEELTHSNLKDFQIFLHLGISFYMLENKPTHNAE